MRRQLLHVTLLRSSVVLPGKGELCRKETCAVFPHNKTHDHMSWISRRPLLTKCMVLPMKAPILALSTRSVEIRH